MLTTTIFCLITCGLSATIARWMRDHAHRLRLIQAVDRRSSHARPTPTAGGAAIVISATIFLMAQSCIDNSQWPAIPIITLIALTLAIVGFIDDRGNVSFKIRLFVQGIAVATFLLYFGASLGETFKLSPGTLAAGALILFSGMWWINLFNFMDGIDGIAAVEALFLLVTGALMTSWAKYDGAVHPLSIAMLLIAFAVFGFLVFNWAPARIFMGDTGSTWLAFMIFALALYTTAAAPLTLYTWCILGAAFITDATFTLAVRFFRREQLSKAHRSHAYQRLARLWGENRTRGHRIVTLLFAAINVCWLTPFAILTVIHPSWSMLWVAIAYLPLIIGALLIGAGLPDHVPPPFKETLFKETR